MSPRSGRIAPPCVFQHSYRGCIIRSVRCSVEKRRWQGLMRHTGRSSKIDKIHRAILLFTPKHNAERAIWQRSL